MWRSSRLETELTSARTTGQECERPAVLVIAATDSSGGAGLVRDVRVLHDFSVDALCAVTAVTAQSDAQVYAVHHVPPAILRAQIRAAFATRRIGAVKIGMLGCRATVDAVVDALAAESSVPVVLDPVLVSSSGGVLLDAEGCAALREQLLPHVSLVTPNIPEAAALLNMAVVTSESALIAQAQRLLDLGPQAVLLKGGHSEGSEAIDLLLSQGTGVQRLVSTRVGGTIRGSGCALASAIAARLACSVSLADACRQAKHYVSQLLVSHSG